MKNTVLLELPTDPAILAAVGRIAVHHSQLLHVARLAIKTFNDEPLQDVLLRTRSDGARQLLQQVKLSAQGQFGSGQEYAKVLSFIRKAEVLTEKRNRMIHSLWARTTTGADVLRDDNLGTVGPIPTLRELTDLADELGKLAKKLNGARYRGYDKASNVASY